MAKKQITVTSRADLNKTRNLALARRLEGQNVHGGAPRALPLKEPGRWQVYEANTYANENEFYLMRERGWVPLVPSDLNCSVEESGYRLENGGLVRGPRGQEMLWKMEQSDYQILMAAKTAQNMKGIGSAKQTRQDLANAIAGPMGSEAADFIYNSPGNVIDTITGGEAQ